MEKNILLLCDSNLKDLEFIPDPDRRSSSSVHFLPYNGRFEVPFTVTLSKLPSKTRK